MKYQLPDGTAISLKPLSDADYTRAERLGRPLSVCPTCGGRETVIPGTGGIKQWESRTYRYREAEHECDCQTQLALYARYLLANIGDQYMRLDWNDFQGTAEADTWVRDYVEDWQSFLMHGYGLAFASRSQGVGKTWAATHIGKKLIKQGQTVGFLDFVEMVDAFCDNGEARQMIEHRMRQATFLLLDDVRAGVSERQNELYALKFEVLIRHRTNFNLPTILTTNLTETAFEEEFPRIYSLLAPKQVWVTMNGADFRKKSEMAIENIEMVARNEVRPIT